MEYRKYGETLYVRIDRGDEIVSSILQVCETEGIDSCVYSGIGGCGEAGIQIFHPETGTFELRKICGTLELVSLNGNVTRDESGTRYHHTHALLAYQENGEHRFAAGHIKSLLVTYTAEIELRPVTGGTIMRQFDEETGTGFWKFCQQ